MNPIMAKQHIKRAMQIEILYLQPESNSINGNAEFCMGYNHEDQLHLMEGRYKQLAILSAKY